MAKSKRKLTRTGLRELSLRPYPGVVFVTKDRKAFIQASRELFDLDERSTTQSGRFIAGPSWHDPHTAIVRWTAPSTLAHELGHVVLDLFNFVSIDPIASGGEPFCYLLAQLFKEATLPVKKK